MLEYRNLCVPENQNLPSASRPAPSCLEKTRRFLVITRKPEPSWCQRIRTYRYLKTRTNMQTIFSTESRRATCADVKSVQEPTTTTTSSTSAATSSSFRLPTGGRGCAMQEASGFPDAVRKTEKEWQKGKAETSR